MTSRQKTVLLISPDAEISSVVKAALADKKDLKFEANTSSLVSLNGSAVELAAKHDIVIFSTDPSNAADLHAIETLVKGPHKPTLLALTESDIPLSQARALTRAGVAEVLPLQLTEAELVSQIDRLGREPAAASPTSGEGRVIAIAQARGGIGATTVAINLADQLAAKHGMLKRTGGHSVALVDLDFQFGTIATDLDLPEQDGLMQIAQNGTIPDAAYLEQVMVELPSGVTVLPAPSRFAPLDALRPEQVAALLSELRANFDYVVIDLPRALVNWLEPVIAKLDELIIVADTSVPVIRNSRRLMDFFTTDKPEMPVRIVINREKQPMFAPQALREAEKVLGRSFADWLPDDPRAARAAIDRGKPLSAIASSSPLAKALTKLSARITEALPVKRHAGHEK